MTRSFETEFNTSIVKINTARRHLKDLSKIILEYKLSQPMAVQSTITTTQATVKFAILKKLPADTLSYIGDCIHNLRSSLDVMAVKLVELNNQNTNNVYFPFANEEKDLEDMIKRKNFNRAGKESVELLQAIKPYKGGNNALRAIHDYDIQDKHIDFIPISYVSNLPYLSLPNRNQMFDTIFKNVSDGQMISIIGYEANHVLKTGTFYTPVNLELVFPKQSVFSEMLIVLTLDQMINDIEGIVKAFGMLAIGKV